MADADKRPEQVANSVLNDHFLMGISAYGQVKDDKENGMYSLFMTREKRVDTYITVDITDDEDYMNDVFEETVNKFKKLNKHMKFVSVRVEDTNTHLKKFIVIRYETIKEHEKYERINTFFR